MSRPEPVINVPAPIVTVAAAPAPVVNLPAPQVTVSSPPRTAHIVRDQQGRISGIVEA